MTSIESLTLEVPDRAAANAFYTPAFGSDHRGPHAPRTRQRPAFVGSRCR
jgi:hypothetical protein